MIRLAALLLTALSLVAAPSVREHLETLQQRFDVVFVYDADLDFSGPGPAVLPDRDLDGCLRSLFDDGDIEWTFRGRYVILRRRTRTPEDSLAHRFDAILAAALIRSERPVREEHGALELHPADFGTTPVLLGVQDVLKRLVLEPGIQATTEGGTGLVVRGGDPGGNLVLLDGTPLYYPSHCFGYLSIFDPDLVRSVQVYKGHFPARYYGRASSVIDVENRDGAGDRLHGQVGIGLVTDKLLLEGPLGTRTTVLVNGRIVQTALVKGLLKAAEADADYFFHDLYARITHRFSPQDRVFAAVYQGRDRMDLHPDSDGGTDVDLFESWGTTTATAGWDHTASPSLDLRAALSWNHFLVREDLFESDIRDLRAAGDLVFHPGGRHRIRAGGGCSSHGFAPKTVQRRTSVVYDVSLYVEDQFCSGPWTLSAGLHGNLFITAGRVWSCPQPRLSGRYATGPWRFHAAAGRMVQHLHALASSSSFSMPTDLWVPVSRNLAPMTSDQVSLGAAWEGPFTVSAEIWHKDMRHVLEYRDNRLAHIYTGYWENNVAVGTGRARGLEVAVARPAGKTTGQLSYTLSHSERRFDDIDGGRWFPYAHDRRHHFVVTVAHRFSSSLEVSALWTYLSGGYMSVPDRYTFVLKPGGGFESLPAYAGRNNFHLPPSHRLDVGAVFRKHVRRGEHRWEVGIYNAYAARNPNAAMVDTDADGRISVTYFTSLSLLPALGWSFRF